MQTGHFISSSAVSDFEVDGLTFEIEGKKKGKKQIAEIPQGQGFIVKDDTEYVYQNAIPLWMFGFIY